MRQQFLRARRAWAALAGLALSLTFIAFAAQRATPYPQATDAQAPLIINVGGAALAVSQPQRHLPGIAASALASAELPTASPPSGYLGPCYRFLPEVPLDGANTLTIRYAPDESGSIPEDTLSIYWYDAGGDSWIEVPSAVDTNAKTVTAGVTNLGTFALSAPRLEEAPTQRPATAPAPPAVTARHAAGGPSAASAPPASSPSVQAAAAITVSVAMLSFQFSPVEVTVPPGATITWTNDDAFPHTVTADPANPVPGGPNSGTAFPLGLSQGEQFSWPVPPTAAEGTKWFYHCQFHGFPGDGTSPGVGMTGSITVQTFNDVPAGSPQAPYILAIYKAGITSGCSVNPPLYCPDASVTRAQMAKFLCIAAGKQPLNRAVPTFSDVPATHPFYGYIERLADAASWGGNPPTTGCAADNPATPENEARFCPNGAVTREQMAKFLCRATNRLPTPSCLGTFGDVPPSNSFCTFIERLTDPASWPGGVAVTSGCAVGPPPLYCPKSNVTRGQMAVFIVRAFGIPL